jgi:branched-chain amino acid aminotransferase
MDIPFTQQQINDAQRQVVAANNLKEAYLRPIVFLGSEGMGLRAEGLTVHVGIAAWEWPSYMSPEALEAGIKVRTSSYTRHHVNITMVKAKACGNYINSLLALREALASGCEEAILLDPEGYVCEGSGENFFMVRDGVIYTPELTSCLDGITRNTVIRLANELGYEVREKRISRDEVYIADEAFFTGTAAEVLPICRYDDRAIGCGKRGPIATQLQAAYFDVVRGRNADHRDWLAPIAG